MPKPPRLARIDGDVAYIPLSQGYEAAVDLADLPLVADFCWSAQVVKSGGEVQTVYAVRVDYSGERPKGVKMHRLLAGFPDGMEVDHWDGNGLNNRRGNLRIATRAQNGSNQRRSTANTSGHKGVSYIKAARKWQATIGHQGGARNLGQFDTKEAAAAAYAEASAALHGEFGRTA